VLSCAARHRRRQTSRVCESRWLPLGGYPGRTGAATSGTGPLHTQSSIHGRDDPEMGWGMTKAGADGHPPAEGQSPPSENNEPKGGGGRRSCGSSLSGKSAAAGPGSGAAPIPIGVVRPPPSSVCEKPYAGGGRRAGQRVRPHPAVGDQLLLSLAGGLGALGGGLDALDPPGGFPLLGGFRVDLDGTRNLIAALTELVEAVEEGTR
jgi:hypothetical protein